MTRSWAETATDAEAERQGQAFWRQLRTDVQQGTFWADEIKQLHGDPPARLEKAMQNLPLPAAFREAAVALRAMIRTKRKNGEDWDQELGLLYWLAAIDSFRLDRSERLNQPGFNVMSSIPARRLFELPFDYDTLGYRHLTLLKKTDVKWLRERFGEPRNHTTLNALHPEVWREYEDKTAEQQARERDRLHQDLGRLSETVHARPGMPDDAAAPRAGNKTPRASQLARWILIAFVLLILLLVLL
ncbi:hypothetical protein CKO28_01105 [Rhodovibrio sodomensis]|uniref:Uncharacterized protein n=1 Tax=Rhodovibrio sodomensis TaxID=1088 RepID=A0ABS1D9I9_9PROT|nr:hypothetical protein [Rhodovibrio sodomensis]MBK1666641.1 hypothetical protein [Rhodovibrio sodomensis]